MIKRLAALLVFLHFSVAYSQTIKTDVLVIGGTPSGVAAAVQSARSKVKTVLVERGNLFHDLFNTINDYYIEGDQPHWGIMNEVMKCAYADLPQTVKTGNDQSFSKVELNALIHIADTVKNLSIDTNTEFVSIKKSGDYWLIEIRRDGKTQTIRSRVVVDATDIGVVLIKTGAKTIAFDEQLINNNSTNYRTSIATGISPIELNSGIQPQFTYPPSPNYCIPVKALIAVGVDNLLVTEKFIQTDNSSEYQPNWPEKKDDNLIVKIKHQHIRNPMLYFPAGLTLGQGAGAIAAYCAFFKTTTANLKPRLIQGELLDFKGYLLPLADIGNDPYWRAIQQICATGLLKGRLKVIDERQQFVFMPDSIVTTAEVKPVLLEIYSRAFLWFNAAKPEKEFTVGNLLSFISELTLTDPDVLQKKIEKEWSEKFKFQSAFDMGRPITRREFAILANQYLNPFGRAVDLDGRIVN